MFAEKFLFCTDLTGSIEWLDPVPRLRIDDCFETRNCRLGPCGLLLSSLHPILVNFFCPNKLEHPSRAGSFACEIAGMVEAQLIELTTAVLSVQAQMMAGEAARSNLQAQVERLGRTTGERTIGVDTRNLGRPSQFSGTDSGWRDWSVVFRSYAARVHPALKVEMQRVERLSTAETNVGFIETEQVQASTDLYHLLLHSTSGAALDRVVNAGSPAGLRAWHLLVERYDPHIRSRTARQLLSLLQFDFSGDNACEARGMRSGVVRTSFEREDLRWLACGDCSEPSDRRRACDALAVEF